MLGLRAQYTKMSNGPERTKLWAKEKELLGKVHGLESRRSLK